MARAGGTPLADPAEADKLMKIQRDLDETKIILHKTIESVLQRGERLDSLVEKSSDLSAASQKLPTMEILYKQILDYVNSIYESVGYGTAILMPDVLQAGKENKPMLYYTLKLDFPVLKMKTPG
ncbi:hypothetical protein OsI_04553 [Oryza sativa Indica Group]|uniref:V-SNARE coiled-coil homology domain-containing protein n=1 Tax=Oryza sativa subsp. indica TaxID=39946 RepID=A2WXA8_ORYSI|nr:hypothetical protein OsI_04553 [Oryza sativa Indica Group]